MSEQVHIELVGGPLDGEKYFYPELAPELYFLKYSSISATFVSDGIVPFKSTVKKMVYRHSGRVKEERHLHEYHETID